jgi:hypothetical protein
MPFKMPSSELNASEFALCSLSSCNQFGKRLKRVKASKTQNVNLFPTRLSKYIRQCSAATPSSTVFSNLDDLKTDQILIETWDTANDVWPNGYVVYLDVNRHCLKMQQRRNTHPISLY